MPKLRTTTTNKDRVLGRQSGPSGGRLKCVFGVGGRNGEAVSSPAGERSVQSKAAILRLPAQDLREYGAEESEKSTGSCPVLGLELARRNGSIRPSVFVLCKGMRR